MLAASKLFWLFSPGLALRNHGQGRFNVVNPMSFRVAYAQNIERKECELHANPKGMKEVDDNKFSHPNEHHLQGLLSYLIMAIFFCTG